MAPIWYLMLTYCHKSQRINKVTIDDEMEKKKGFSYETINEEAG